MDETTRCTICRAVMPAVSSALGKALGSAVFTTVGLKKSNDPVERFAMFLVGLGLGHVGDRLIAELARPVCGGCRGIQPDRT